jgi:hypothetical protein
MMSFIPTTTLKMLKVLVCVIFIIMMLILIDYNTTTTISNQHDMIKLILPTIKSNNNHEANTIISNPSFYRNNPNQMIKINKIIESILGLSTSSQQLITNKYNNQPEWLPTNSTFRQTKKPIPWLKWNPNSSSREINQLLQNYSSNEAIQRCLQNRRIYIVGSSYQRSLFLDLLRILNIKLTPRMVYSPYSENHMTTGENCSLYPPTQDPGWFLYQKLPNTVLGELLSNGQSPWCMWIRNVTICRGLGLAGFTTHSCGIPPRTEVKHAQLNITVVYQFKTYLRTPLLDSIIRKELQTGGHYDVILISNGEWGIGGKESGKYFPEVEQKTHLDLANEYLDYIFNGWDELDGRNRVIISRCHGGGLRICRACDAACEAAQKLSRKILQFPDFAMVNALTRYDMVAKTTFRTVHGFDGPLTEWLVRSFFSVICSPII